VGLNNLLASEFVVPEATQGTSIDEKKLGEIVKHAVAVQLENSTAAPTYEAVAVRLPTVSQEKTQAQAPQYKITIVPELRRPKVQKGDCNPARLENTGSGSTR
jgi:hypothetical protein